MSTDVKGTLKQILGGKNLYGLVLEFCRSREILLLEMVTRNQFSNLLFNKDHPLTKRSLMHVYPSSESDRLEIGEKERKMKIPNDQCPPTKAMTVDEFSAALSKALTGAGALISGSSLMYGMFADRYKLKQQPQDDLKKVGLHWSRTFDLDIVQALPSVAKIPTPIIVKRHVIGQRKQTRLAKQRKQKLWGREATDVDRLLDDQHLKQWERVPFYSSILALDDQYSVELGLDDSTIDSIKSDYLNGVEDRRPWKIKCLNCRIRRMNNNKHLYWPVVNTVFDDIHKYRNNGGPHAYFFMALTPGVSQILFANPDAKKSVLAKSTFIQNWTVLERDYQVLCLTAGVSVSKFIELVFDFGCTRNTYDASTGQLFVPCPWELAEGWIQLEPKRYRCPSQMMYRAEKYRRLGFKFWYCGTQEQFASEASNPDPTFVSCFTLRDHLDRLGLLKFTTRKMCWTAFNITFSTLPPYCIA